MLIRVGATVITAAIIVVATATAARAAECSPQEQLAGGCTISGTITDDDVTLEGDLNAPGTPGSTDPGGAGPTGPADPLDDCIYLLNDRCLAAGPGRVGPVDPITLADIAQFRPDAGVDRMEPDGWMIVGLDTNFYADGGIQVVQGTLLGQSASVRFTPVAWHWSYGDGTGRSSATHGAPWASQGIREFDPTATSHVYRAPGTYVIDLTIDFTAEYRFGSGPWLDIAGVLSLPANRLTAVAGDAKTVLVERECTVDPTGPGC